MKKIKYILYATFAILLMYGCDPEPQVELELSVKEVFISNIDGNGTITVSANSNWTATLSSTWCSISPTSGNGNGEITITASDNFNDENRGVVLYVTSKGVKKSATIRQDFSKLEIDKNQILFSKQGSIINVAVVSNTNWQIEIQTGTNWISANTYSGKGNAEIAITATPNEGKQRESKIFFKYASGQRELIVIQERSINTSPNAPIMKSPVNNLNDANRLPTFRWGASKDPDGDIVTYRIEYSLNQTNWNNSIHVSDTVYNLPAYLDENKKYYWRVVAIDSFGGEGISQVYTFTTGTKTSYFDGQYKVAQTYTKGSGPSEILFIGDGYVSEDYEEGGIFDRDMNNGIEYFFEIEPYKSYREYFNIYKQAGYSRDRGVKQTDKGIFKNTKFGVDFLGGSSLSADTDEVFRYAKMITGVDDIKLRDMLIILVVNQDRYAGTCWIWTDGKAIAICPVSTSTAAGTHFRNLIYHEAGGHGFGRLADEYTTAANAGKTINDEYKSKYNTFKNAGFYPNIDLTGDLIAVKWKHFINLSGYSRVGAVEGGFYFPLGVWRPEQTSCMMYNEPYYNAPSREKMVQRILSAAQEPYSLEIFRQKDIQKAPSQSVLLQTKSINPLTFVPLAPPVMMK
jgi:hypothetical protein